MGSSLKIKVCGMRDRANLEALCGLGPDFVGFIFYGPSPRYVGESPNPDLFRIPGKSSRKVGVFVNEPLENVRKICGRGWLDLVQLHGSESPAYCKALVRDGMQVIKAFGPGNMSDTEGLQSYAGVVQYFLFDTPTPSHGGSGKKFDWSLLDAYDYPLPFFLSGGIGPGDTAQIKELIHPCFTGVDLNSRFEKVPGMKDMELLSSFMKEIRK